MKFKVDDLIILTEEGIKHYWITSDGIGEIIRVLSTNNETLDVYGYKLNDLGKNTLFLRSVYYRITTESEIKVYKLKNLFVKRN
jgi:hypothetical protein